MTSIYRNKSNSEPLPLRTVFCSSARSPGPALRPGPRRRWTLTRRTEARAGWSRREPARPAHPPSAGEPAAPVKRGPAPRRQGARAELEPARRSGRPRLCPLLLLTARARGTSSRGCFGCRGRWSLWILHGTSWLWPSPARPCFPFLTSRTI